MVKIYKKSAATKYILLRPFLAFVLLEFLGLANLAALPPLHLTFAGDIMAHDSNYEMADFARIYRRVAPLLQRDALNFANLEFVIDERRPYSTYPLFNVHSKYVEAAIAAGFNVFSLANNHSADFGPAGLRATAQSSYRLQQRYPKIIFSGLRIADKIDKIPGTSANFADFSMAEISHRGWRVGFTAISILTNKRAGLAGLQYLAAGDELGLQNFYLWLSRRRSRYDLVVVSVHGGKEYQLEASAQKTDIMRQIARAGADIVWGHHPHVQQPWEVYRELGDQRHWALIMYSQGNFISAQTIRTKPTEPHGFWAATGDSVLLQLEIAQSGAGQLELRSLQPQLLTTIRLQPFAFATVPMATAAAEMRQQGYRGWENFYAQHQNWLKRRVARWPTWVPLGATFDQK